MSEKLSKYIAAFDYVDKTLIVLSATSGGISIIIVGTGVLTSLFYEDPPPNIAYLLLLQILSSPSPLPCCLQPHLHCSFCFLLSLAWVITPHVTHTHTPLYLKYTYCPSPPF